MGLEELLIDAIANMDEDIGDEVISEEVSDIFDYAMQCGNLNIADDITLALFSDDVEKAKKIMYNHINKPYRKMLEKSRKFVAEEYEVCLDIMENKIDRHYNYTTYDPTSNSVNNYRLNKYRNNDEYYLIYVGDAKLN